MRKRLALFVWLIAITTCACAETIVLHTGARVQGTIVFQNNDVVIVRDASGARSQYPRTDIKEILADETVIVEEVKEDEQSIETPKKASILLEIAGGAGVQPAESAGGAVSADLLVGTHHIANRHVFVGAGVGYHGLFLTGEKYNFLPIQAAVRMPLTEEKHAPMFGVAVGYGIALSKTYRGGLYAGIDFGYRCQLNPRSAIGLTAYAQFQQARVPVNETVQESTYTNFTGRSLIATGLKLSLYF